MRRQPWWLLILTFGAASTAAQISTHSDTDRINLAKQTRIAIIGKVVSASALVDPDKMQSQPVPSATAKPDITNSMSVPLPNTYEVGLLTSIRVIKVLRTNEAIKPGDLIQIVGDSKWKIESDSSNPSLTAGQEYLLMLSRPTPDDLRLGKNILIETSAPNTRRANLRPFPRANVYNLPHGFYDVVSIRPENQKLLKLISETISKQ